MLTKIGLEGLKRAIPRAGSWYEDAVMRAVRAKAPPQMIEDLGAISRQQAETAAALEGATAVMPAEGANTAYLSLYNDLLEAGERDLPSFYKQAVIKARNVIERGYRNAVRQGRRPQAGITTEPVGTEALTTKGQLASQLDGDILGGAIEEARGILAQASVPTKTSVPKPIDEPILQANREGYQALRGLRDQFTASLADPRAMWGEQRAQRSITELQRLQAVHTDPARLARIRALGETTGRVRKQIEDKSYRLMGASTAASSRRLTQKQKREESEIQAQATEQMKRDAASEATPSPLKSGSP